MKFSKEQIDKLILKYDQRAQAAYDNYQDSGAEHYYRTFEKNEAMRDLLTDVKNAEKHIQMSKTFSGCLRRWVADIDDAKTKDTRAMNKVMDSIRAEIYFLEKTL